MVVQTQKQMPAEILSDNLKNPSPLMGAGKGGGERA
jgi:hypothetical protein